jgi:hypothetical protein
VAKQGALWPNRLRLVRREAVAAKLGASTCCAVLIND